MKRVVYLATAVSMLLQLPWPRNQFLPSAEQDEQAHSCVRLGLSGVKSLQSLWQGVRNGVDLAAAQWKSKLASVHVSLKSTIHLDDAAANGLSYDPNVEAGNANTCAGKSDTLGYIGTLNSGAALRFRANPEPGAHGYDQPVKHQS